MKKTRLLVSLGILSTSAITPVIALASCGTTTTYKAIPVEMLNMEGNVLLGLKDGASIDSYDTLEIPENIVVIADEAFKDAFKEETNSGSSIKTVIFNKNLRSIGSASFQNCTSLTSLDLTRMTDIKIMSLLLKDETTFLSCSNKSGTVKLPDGITDMQFNLIKELFTKAGLPGSWFGDKEAPDQETVNNINSLLEEQTTPCKTMSDMIAYVKAASIIAYGTDKVIDLEQLQPTNANEQYVWDSLNNKVVQIDQNGNLTCGPTDEEYSLPKEVYIWKMVKPSTANVVTRSATTKANGDDIYADGFSSTTLYSQYLRTGYTFTSSTSNPLLFKSGLDTGNQYNLVLEYNNEEGHGEVTPVINTQKCELTIDGPLDSIDHYGNLTMLTVDSIGSATTQDSYNEYGSVDAAIIVKSGTISLESTAEVNEVIITDVTNVTVVVEKGSDVGTIGTSSTSAEAQAAVDDIVSGTGESDVGEVRTSGAVEEPKGETGDFYSGEGTINAPYTIKNATQLKKFRDLVNSQAAGGKYLYFNLIADINMEDEGVWTPVGTKEVPFKGDFNGCGFSIKNITYKAKQSTGQTEDYRQKHDHVGFFGYTEGRINDGYDITGQIQIGDGFITDISTIWKYKKSEGEKFEDGHFDETNITEDKYTTHIKNLTIENVRAVGTDSEDVDKYFVGGIVGVGQYTHFYNCKVTSGIIQGRKHVGGICGSSGSCIYKDCVVGEGDKALTITAEIYHAGGMAGSVAYCNTDIIPDIRSCCMYGCVTGSNCTIQINGPDATGGCVAGMSGDNQATEAACYESCINNANIVVKSIEGGEQSGIICYGAAGICCRGQNVDVVSNCINYGDITVPAGNYAGYVAGIIAEETAHYVLNCHNGGKLTGNSYSLAGIAAGCTAGAYIDAACSNLEGYYLNNTWEGKPQNEIHDKPSSI